MKLVKPFEDVKLLYLFCKFVFYLVWSFSLMFSNVSFCLNWEAKVFSLMDQTIIWNQSFTRK